MVKLVLTTKADPTYDDLPEHRYHFPRTYLKAVQQGLGDWAIYYEPRRTSGDQSSRGGKQAYFAAVRIDRIEKDPINHDHFYAFVSGFIPFENDVPFLAGDHYYESALKRSDGKTNKGAFGRAVRHIPDHEFDLILQAGFVQLLASPSKSISTDAAMEFAEEPATFQRPVLEQLVARPFRDAAFSRLVKQAYSDTCAVSGLRIINGGGRSEVQAAHIRPVASQGPDSVRNGLALSGTIHWMFDRGLISIDDDYSILAARDRAPDTIERLIRPDRKIAVPIRSDLRPHPQFLKYHREEVFKG